MRYPINLILQPTLICIFALAFGIANLWRRRSESKCRLAFVTIPFVLLVVSSLPIVNHLAFWSLEHEYAESYSRPEPIDAIVVLGGYVAPPTPKRPHANLGNDSLVRCLHAVRLYRAGPPCPIIVTGGNLQPEKEGPSIAEAMAQFLIQDGVPTENLIVESESQNTYENAVMAGKIIRARGFRRVAIVTEAMHMCRSKWCFEKQGIDVAPSACSFRTSNFENSIDMYLPNSRAASELEKAIHEWVGICYYWSKGWL